MGMLGFLAFSLHSMIFRTISHGVKPYHGKKNIHNIDWLPKIFAHAQVVTPAGVAGLRK